MGMKGKKMKKNLVIILILAMLFTIVSCGKPKSTTDESDDKEEESKVTEEIVEGSEGEVTEEITENGDSDIQKSACFITQYGLSSPFTQLCWGGYERLESEDNWKIKMLEVTEATEFADAIRSMAAEGYDVITVLFDTLSGVAVELSDELEEMYPNLKILLCDSYYENNTNNCVNIICDPWESSFIAGYLAAHETEKDVVGWIGHSEQASLDRFKYGYEAGVKYADNGVNVVNAYTGDSADSVKGQEAAKAMIQTHDVDIIYQTANLSGIGVILECKEQGIRCIGVDIWQGGEYGQETVFWSALKPIDDALYTACVQAAEGELNTRMIYYDLAHGATAFDERDFDLLSEDMQDKISELVEKISDGTVDVYEGYDDYRYEGE